MWLRRVVMMVFIALMAAACSSEPDLVSSEGDGESVDEFSSDSSADPDTELSEVPVTTIPVGDELPGTSWIITAVDGRPVPDVDGSIRFSVEDFGGFDGCNSFGGDLALDNAGFSVGQVGTTDIGCDPDFTVPIAGMFSNGASFTVLIQGDQLLLTRSDGRTIEGLHFQSTSINN
ncbi:MAG: META domain-containing protein [Acidimicrobiales bacterium]